MNVTLAELEVFAERVEWAATQLESAVMLEDWPLVADVARELHDQVRLASSPPNRRALLHRREGQELPAAGGGRQDWIGAEP